MDNSDELLIALEGNPHLSDAIERNIRTLTALRHKEARERTLQEKVADAITAFSGSMAFVYIHVLLFAAWIVLNTKHFGLKPFDPYPFNFLTMVVSLEAIFLSTFVLVSQNRMSVQADKRADLDLHIGLFAEHEITRILRMLDAIQDKLGIENEEDGELAELEKEVRLQDVLGEIAHIEQHLTEKEKQQGNVPLWKRNTG